MKKIKNCNPGPCKHCNPEPEPEEGPDVLALLNGPAEPRATGIYGEINDENCAPVLANLVSLLASGKHEDEETGDVEYEPIEFYLSTPGGSLYDMFAIYDMITHIKEQGCEVKTVGIGQVMSAGILLLASGTKGSRKVGRHCRLMLHDVRGEAHGLTRVLQESVDEIQRSKEDLVSALKVSTKMKEKEIRKMLAKGTDYFFGAEEAVKLGIADEIIG